MELSGRINSLYYICIAGLLKIIDCLFLLRLLLLVPVWTVLLLGWITGNSVIKPGMWCLTASAQACSTSTLWQSLVSFSFIVAFIYVVNQIFDIESDRINHKLFILPHGLISVRTAWVCALICACIGIGTALYWFDSVIVSLYVLSLVLGICYDIPPISLKNRAWGGLIANFFGHGMITFLIGYYASQFPEKTGVSFAATGLIPSLSAGFANAAVFLTTTIPDAAGDKRTGKKTFCVIYGPKITGLSAALCCGFALFCAFFLTHNQWVMIIPCALSSIIFIYYVVHPNQELVFKTFRWPVFILSLFVSIFIPYYAVIILITVIISRIYYKRRFNYEYPTFKAK